jgi:excisionase family DNA binding protein
VTPDEFTEALKSLDISIDQFAERSGTHRTTVYRWVREGEIPKWAVWTITLLLERERILDDTVREILKRPVVGRAILGDG